MFDIPCMREILSTHVYNSYRGYQLYQTTDATTQSHNAFSEICLLSQERALNKHLFKGFIIQQSKVTSFFNRFSNNSYPHITASNNSVYQATNFIQRVSLCITLHRHEQKRAPHCTHVQEARQPQTLQKCRRAVELGGPTAARKYVGTWAGKASKFSCSNKYNLGLDKCNRLLDLNEVCPMSISYSVIQYV